MKTRLLILALSLSCVGYASATVSFDIQAEQLRDATGTPLSTTALAFLVADTGSNGFGAITANSSTAVNSLLNGDDKILARFDLSGGTTGALFTAPAGITVAQGTPLALLWFPSLTTASSTIADGTAYGMYTSAVAVPADGSSAWIAPTNGVSGYALHFFTSAATNFNTGGTNPATAGNATLSVGAAPEPGRALLGAMGLGAFLMRRRRAA